MKKRLISMLLVICMVISMLPINVFAAQMKKVGTTEEDPFSDVKKGDWFYDGVMYALENGLFKGISDTEFNPGGTMTRAMYVTVLGRIAEIKPEDYARDTGFSDVPKNHWAAPYVLWAKENNITGGVGAGRFGIDGLINREQMATFTVRFFEKYGIPFPEKITDIKPKDLDSVADYAQEAVLKLWFCGLFKGDSQGNFNPRKNASRAEAAAFCGRTDEKVEAWYIETGKKKEPEKPTDKPSSSATYYTFKFVTNDGTSISDRSIMEGKRLDNLPVPYKANSIFVGWCYDKDMQKLVADTDTAQKSTILYAKYEDIQPLNEEEQTPVALAIDTGKSFTVQIAAPKGMTLKELKEGIATKNLSSNEEKEWFKIEGGNGIFTISGLNYLGEKGAAQPGFVEGSAYKITLEDDDLTFAGQDPSARTYDFTIKREEVVNVGINEKVKNISLSDISNLTVNGQTTDTISIPVITIGVQGQTIDDGITTGSFSCTKELAVGDTIMVYSGDTAPSMENAMGGEDTAFVEITGKTGNSYTYKTADSENVLFTPDVLPVSNVADTDGKTDDNAITVPVAVMTYTDDRFALAGLDSQTTIDKGDFIAFYSGTMKDDGTIENGKTEAYAEITSVVTVGGDYVITYKIVTLSEMQVAMAACKKENMDGDTLLEGVNRAKIEQGVEQQARDSGFADEAGMYLAALALETDSFTKINDKYELKAVEMQMNGEPITQETLRLMGSDSKVEVELSKLQATLGTELVHFKGIDGLRLTLDVGITITIHGKKADIEIEVTGSFEQEVSIDIGVDGDAVWSWWGIFPYISEYEVTAYVELYEYTGIGIEATITTKEQDEDEGFGTKNEEIEKIGKQIKDLMDKKEKYIGDGSGTVSDSLEEKYAAMLENESDWVTLFEKAIVEQEFRILLIIVIEFEVKFAVTANMNITLGIDFWYENAKRYIYTVQVYKQGITNEVIDLVEEHYEFEFYIMGTMGLRAGIKLELKVGLFSTDLASVGFAAEVGAYVRVWGYFYYQLSYRASTGKTSSYSGALLFELGVYIEITFEAQALKGTFKYNPTLYDEEWPILKAGSQENVRNFAYEQEEAPKIGLKQYITTTQVPDSIFEMAYLDLKDGLDDGELFTAVYDSEGKEGALEDQDPENNDDEANFKISMTNKAFSYNPKTNQITVNPGNEPKQEGEMIITWITQPLAFSSAPLERRISLHWDNLRDGYVIAPFTSGGSYVPIMVKKYEEKILAPQNPTKEGYIFAGWFKNEGLTQDYTFPELMPNVDTNIYAKWEPATDTKYTVEHYQQILGSSEYQLAEIETLRGTTETKVKPLTKSYEGYITPEQKELVILPDGSATLRYYYDLQTYTVTFKPGEVGGNEEVIKLKYGSTITAPQFAAKGYIFKGWDSAVSSHMGDQNLTYTAQWEKDNTTEYRVEYYVQQPDGRFMLQDMETRHGKTGEKITANGLCKDNQYEVEGITSFQNVTLNGEPIDTATITGDGRTVIKVNYRRIQYTVTFKPENGSSDIVYTLYSGAKIVPPAITKTGYVFANWGDVAGTVEKENLTYTATWTARTDIYYTVKHLRQNLDDSYPTAGALVETETKTDGTTGAQTKAEAKTYEGFTPDSVIKQTEILPDGSAVVEIKYSRNSYTVNWKTDNDVYKTEQVKYGGIITPPNENPTKQGYIFTSWQGLSEGATMGIVEQNFTAAWAEAADTPYTVRHIRQALDGSYPTEGALVETENKQGTTNTQTAAVAKSYEGFTAGAVAQTNILADGTAEAVIKYSRNSYNITWLANGETFETTNNVKFGANIMLPATAPTNKVGYTFKEWLGVPQTMPAQNSTYIADWTPNTYTVTLDVNGGNQLSESTIEATYDQTYGVLPEPTRDGYLFTGWVDSNSATVTAETMVKTAIDHTLTATWAANNATPYKVRHYQQNILDDEYTQIGSDETKYGETDALSAAVANTYEGFTVKAFDQVSISGDGSAVINIYYDRNVHTITWDINGIIQEQNYRYGASVTAPAAERTGHTFTGWNIAPVSTMPDRDLSYTALWIANTYTVSFDGNGGSGSGSITVTYGGTYPVMAAPTRTGYTFGGWYTAKTAGTQVTEGDSVAITENQTLYANWTANTYTVSFDLNGGTGTAPAGITVTYDGMYGNLPANTSTKTGCSFVGWFTSASGGTKIENATTVKTASNHTLYARWTVNEYTITFDSGVTEIKANYGATVTLPAAAKQGYTFAGWKNGEITYNANQQIAMPEGGLLLIAQWTINQYTISFDSNGGTSVTPLTADFGATITAPMAPSKNGYTFSGWQKDGLNYNFEQMPAENISLTAKWDAVNYNITYANVEGIDHGNATSYTIESNAISLDAPTGTKTGYTFAGWYTSADFVETSKIDGVAISAGSSGVKTFYAKWTANQYGVIFDDNTQSNQRKSQSFTYDQSQALQTMASLGFTNNGYTFKGWSTAENGTGTAYTDGQSVKNLCGEGSITLYAQWQPISYTISYTLGVGGSGNTNPTSYNITTNDIVLKDPSTIHPGFQFIGWYDGSTKVTTIQKGSTGNRNLTAKWEHGGTFSLSYVSSGGTTSTYSITRTIPAGAVPTADTQYVYYRTVNGTAIGGTAEAVHFKHVGGENVFATFGSNDGNGSVKTFTVSGENVSPTYIHTGGGSYIATAYTNGESRYYSVELYKVVNTVGNCTGTIDGNAETYKRTLTQASNYIISGTDLMSYKKFASQKSSDGGQNGWKITEGQNPAVISDVFVYQDSNYGNSTPIKNYIFATATGMGVQLRSLKGTDDGWRMYRIVSFNSTKAGFRYGINGDINNTDSYSVTLPAPIGALPASGTLGGRTVHVTEASGVSGTYGDYYVAYGLNDTCTINITCFNEGAAWSSFWFNSAELWSKVLDSKKPTQIGIAPMAEGVYKRGDTIRISVVYDEIIADPNQAALGAITGLSLTNAVYESGYGTNVLTFTATVNQDSYTVNNITLMNQKPVTGLPKDCFGNN